MSMIEGGVALDDAELQLTLDEMELDDTLDNVDEVATAGEVAEIVEASTAVEEGLGSLASLRTVARPVDPNPPKRQLMISLGFDMVFHSDGTIEHVPHWVPLPD